MLVVEFMVRRSDHFLAAMYTVTNQGHNLKASREGSMISGREHRTFSLGQIPSFIYS
jgi:hypothetical protein